MKTRRPVVLAVVVASALFCLLLRRAAAEEWWDVPALQDDYAADALLDLRGMNEEESGATGFIAVNEDGTGFVRGDGAPIRFWGVASNPNTNWSPEQIDAHFRFLAKRGVNFVRMHCHIADESTGAAITDVDRQELDAIFRYVAAAKKNGIYLLISPYWYHRKIPASWKLEGYKEGDMPVAALFWNERYQAAYREWTRVLYTTKNPYTSLAIGQDPTVAMLKMKNEDGLFFWTSLTDRIPPEQMDLLRARFGQWAAAEYGSVQGAVDAWDGKRLDGDDLAAGRLGFHSVWEMTQPNIRGKRMADQVRFLAEVQRGFYADVVDYLREELKCRQLTASMSWRTADKQLLEDIERWTYTVNDVLTQNIYFQSGHEGQFRIYRIDPGDTLVSYSATRRPWLLPTNIKQTVGQPTVITEVAWVTPNRYQSEGPVMTAAQQALSGIAASCWFHPAAPEWESNPFFPFGKTEQGHLVRKWVLNNPMGIGMFPAPAVAFRAGLIAPGRTLVHEERSLSELWQREPPIIAESNAYDPLQDAVDRRGEYTGGPVSRLAFLAGRVEVQVHEGEAGPDRVADLGELIDTEAGRVRASNGQIVHDYKAGLWRLTAPAAQAAAGFLGAREQPIECGDLQLWCENEYATVMAVAMDGRPLAESERVLLQCGTIQRPTGWRTEPVEGEEAKLRIVNTGHAPMRVQSLRGRFALANPGLATARVLDLNGYAVGTLPLERTADGIRGDLPAEALYILLTP